MGIKVGEYCRTETGYIAKLIEKNKDLMNFDGNIISRYGEESTYLYSDKYWGDETKEIIKHSPNIIDLIEVGDVLEIQEEDGEIAYLGLKQDTTTMTYKALIEDIKNGEVKLLGIVTHESFNSIKYEVI